jgi:hypothetical protein
MNKYLIFFHPLNFEVADGAKIAQDGVAGCISIGAGTCISPMEPPALKVYITPVKIDFRGPDCCFQLYQAKSKDAKSATLHQLSAFYVIFVEQE